MCFEKKIRKGIETRNGYLAGAIGAGAEGAAGVGQQDAAAKTTTAAARINFMEMQDF